jgi:phosphate/sulfate permease
VKWGLSLNIFVAWVTTLPVSALVGALCAKLAVRLFGAT